ncbi:cytochrome P450 [Gigaspora rosea]|uniref:Cytochrome P450 n=1 Tax=Gigaspora rosea TaxID=44941 RepID=A0A397VD36_9GLOM|nr:cytochrome P450 [Gigaspora rosea]
MIIQKIIESFGITDYFFVFVLILVTYIFTFYYNYFTRPNPLPGPLPLPFIGNLHNYAYDIKKFFEQCQQKYGDVCEIMFNGSRCVIISRPEYMEKFLHPTTFFNRFPYSQGFDELGIYGHGIAFNEDYKGWNYHRQFFTQALLAPRFMDTTINSTNKLYDELSGYWQLLGKQNKLNINDGNKIWTLETDFSAWLHGFANELVSIVTTDERTYSITSYYNTQSAIKSDHPDALIKDSNKFVNAGVKLMKDILFFLLFGPFMRHYIPIIRNISISKLKNRDYLFERFDTIIKNRRKKIDEMQSVTEMKSDMLTSLITANTTKNTVNVKALDGKLLKPMNDEETSNLFCFMTYFLCKHPHVKQKMLSEIDSIFAKASEKFHLSRDDISKLKYCKAIIKETNRVLPVAIFITRYVTEEHEFIGYKWPAGTQFHLNFLGANNHPEVWPNPEVFDPDRFYGGDKYDQKFVDKNLMMFGGSQRICPGRKLAMTELLLIMALIFRNYNVELVNINEPLKLNIGIAVNCQELKVRISPRI